MGRTAGAGGDGRACRLPRTPRICARHVARNGVDGAQAATGATVAASDRPVVALVMLAGACAEAALTAGEQRGGEHEKRRRASRATAARARPVRTRTRRGLPGGWRESVSFVEDGAREPPSPIGRFCAKPVANVSSTWTLIRCPGSWTRRRWLVSAPRRRIAGQDRVGAAFALSIRVRVGAALAVLGYPNAAHARRSPRTAESPARKACGIFPPRGRPSGSASTCGRRWCWRRRWWSW